MRRLIENIDTLYTCDRHDRVLKSAWIVAEGSTIAALGDGPPPAGNFDDRIDLSGSVALPGLVNTHHHFFQTLTRALPRAQRGQLLERVTGKADQQSPDRLHPRTEIACRGYRRRNHMPPFLHADGLSVHTD